ncbi:MAG: hypothetical protein ABI151_03585 [Chitinophagaceae bacterium]
MTFQWINNTYLGKLFKSDRKLSFWVGGFFVATICCNLLRLEATPFFLWGMYSAIEKSVPTYQVTGIMTGGKSNIDFYSGTSDNSRFFLLSPLQYYKELQEKNEVDPSLKILQKKFPSLDFVYDRAFTKYFDKSSETLAFPGWYAKYLTAQTGTSVNCLRISEITVKIFPQRTVTVDSAQVFLKWP